MGGRWQGTGGRVVREALLHHGFTVDGVLAALGPDAFAALGRGEGVPARHALADLADEPITDLIRVFLLGEAVPAQRLAAALPLADAEGLGMVGRTEGGAQEEIRARLQVRPYPMPDSEGFVVSDFPVGSFAPVARALKPDHVPGVGGASVTLATITPRQPVARTLDLGTGCGIQALLAAAHSTLVVACDRSERAVRMARLSSALSAVEFDTRTGSLFEPVAGEQFDLIVANPPFVISPHARFTYRETALRADDLSRTIVSSAAEYLAPGGTAVVLANWLHVAGQSWHERLASWAPPGCQVWVAQRDLLSPSQYVEVWLRDSAELGSADFDARYAEWLTYLDDLAASGIGFGWIVIRRDDSAWFVAEDLSEAERLPSGDEVLAQLREYSALQEATAPQVLRSAPRWTEKAELHQSWRPQNTDPEGTFQVTGPWRPAESVGPAVVALMGRTGTIASRVEDLAGPDPDSIDQLTAEVLVAIRRLIGAGLVVLDG